jgi:uncharacterized protein (TIGR02246 family)
MRVPTGLSGLAVLVFAAGCQSIAPESDALSQGDLSAVRSLMEETYVQAILAGDLETATAVWAENAVRVPPTAPTLVGYEAIRASYEAMPYTITEFTFKTDNVEGCGDMAVMRGTYSFAAEVEDGGSHSETGTTFLVLRREEDGAWKVTQNTWRPDPLVAEGSDVIAIQGLLEKRLAAAAAGDMDAFMGYLTEDAVLMPPDDPAVEGSEALRSYFEPIIQGYTVNVERPHSSVTVIGNWAFEDYTYELTLTPRSGGAPIVETGKGMFVYRRGADGRWRVARDVWNRDGL